MTHVDPHGSSSRTALVTGAKGGIGMAAVRALEQEGFDVFRADLSIPRSDPAHREISLDVTCVESWKSARQTLIETAGRLDVLVNNAGILRLGAIEEVTSSDWTEVLATNLTGAFLGLQTLLPLLLVTRGNVINVSSVVGLRGNTRMVAYGASKAGLLGLTYATARDLAPHGVRVNAVCPGTVETDMAVAFFGAGPEASAAKSASSAKHPMGRLGTAEEVAEVITFLASSKAGYVTGVALPVDGGRMIA
jgi:NAD(P)-dependent dehydrogenase (short-subunit alcohol dehydrogenase family)